MKILLFLFGIWVFQSYAEDSYIPPQAFVFKPVIHEELDNYFSTIPEYNYIPSLIEHESCISLKNKRCWSSTSELKTSREQGLGLGQVTRTYRSDGSIRFDSLSDLKHQYQSELKDANWETLRGRPDLQIRMLILMSRNNYKSLYNVKNEEARLQMSDAAYNAGLGAVYKKRRACGLSSHCDPGLWFENTEKQCIGLTKPIYGKRSACDIVTYHVRSVFTQKLPKYKRQYFTEATP